MLDASPETVAEWVGAFIAAKVVIEALWDVIVFGKSNFVTFPIRENLWKVIAYSVGLALVAASIHRDLPVVLPLAIAFRAAQMASRRFLVIPNHCFLEFLVLVIYWALPDDPILLTTFLQLVTCSVWVLSAVHKLYDGEVIDGSFFYFTDRHITGPRKVRHVGFWGPIDAEVLRSARRWAALVLAAEIVVPIVGLWFAGTAFGLLAMFALATSVALSSREYNFLLTNLALVSTFAVVPDLSALQRLGIPGYLLAAWCLLWPLVHAALSHRLQFSPWRLFGWGMFSRIYPRLYIVSPEGKLDIPVVRPSSLDTAAKETAFFTMLAFGQCRVNPLRRHASRQFHREVCTTPAVAIVMRWHRLRAGQRMSEFCFIANDAAATTTTLFVHDAATKAALEEHCRALAAAATAPPRS